MLPDIFETKFATPPAPFATDELIVFVTVWAAEAVPVVAFPAVVLPLTAALPVSDVEPSVLPIKLLVVAVVLLFKSAVLVVLDPERTCPWGLAEFAVSGVPLVNVPVVIGVLVVGVEADEPVGDVGPVGEVGPVGDVGPIGGTAPYCPLVASYFQLSVFQ